MDIPMMPGGKRTLVALAVVAGSLWALMSMGKRPMLTPLPAMAADPAPAKDLGAAPRRIP